jgi:hypothetical protein
MMMHHSSFAAIIRRNAAASRVERVIITLLLRECEMVLLTVSAIEEGNARSFVSHGRDGYSRP